MADAAVDNMEAGEPAVLDESVGQPTSPSSEDGVYMCATNSHNRQFKLTPKDLVGVAQEVIKNLDLDSDGHISFSEVIHQATKRIEADHKSFWWKRILAALVIGVFLAVALSAVANITSIEATREFSIKDDCMIAANGQSVRVASTDRGLRVNGELCPLSASGECTSGVVKTGEARSYALLFDLPYFDSRTLASLRELTLLLQDGTEVTLSIVGSLKHRGGRSATFFSTSGNKVVVDSSSMTVLVVVDGQHHSLSNNTQSHNNTQSRRLQEGQQWQPQLYNELDFFTVENGFDVDLDAQTGLQRRLTASSDLSGWAALAISIGEAVVGFYQQGQDQFIQQYASITGRLFVTSSGFSTELDMAILYNKTMPSHSRLHLALGNQAWLIAFGQSMEFAYTGGELHSCEVLSSPTVPPVIQNAASFVETDGMLMAFTEEDGPNSSTDHITMEILSFESDVVAATLQVPDMDECPNRDNSENSLLGGRRLARRLANVEPMDGWKIAQATYGVKRWETAYGASEGATYSDNLPADWVFEKGGDCTIDLCIAKIVKNTKTTRTGVSFAVSADVYNLISRAVTGDAKVVDDVQYIINKNVMSLADCIKQKLKGSKVQLVIGHGLGGATALVYFREQGGQGQGTLSADAEVVTYGAPPTGSKKCHFPGTRYLHINDPLGSSLFAKESEIQHEVANGKIYDDTSARRRWKTWERRRATRWEWTEDCDGESSDSFSSVGRVLDFNRNYDIV